MDPAVRLELVRLFLAAVAAVDGRSRVRESLQSLPGRWHLAAIGKAAPAMALGAHDALGDRIGAGLIIGPYGSASRTLSSFEWRVLEAGHPLPDAASLEAGAALERFVDTAPAGHGLLFLISGGASALAERLPPGMTLPALVELNRWLLASGLDIASVNRVRQAVSCLKGGRLAARLAGRRCRALLISDVAGDDPAVIGSGLLCAPHERAGLPDIPPSILEQLRFPDRRSAAGPPVEHQIVAGLDTALAAAAAAASPAGVMRGAERLDGDARTAGERIARTLLEGGAGFYLWGGEPTVRLPASPGRGGRCQHLALAAALALAGDRHCALLAAGTDGCDGPGDDAGAVIDGGTLERGRCGGLDARECLERADSGAFLEAAGDLLNTGATGTNVADIMIGYRAA